MRLALVLPLLAALGCNGGLTASCMKTTPQGPTCSESTGLSSDDRAGVMVLCRGAGDAGPATGTFADTPCDHSGAVGGCRLSSGAITTTVWYFPPFTETNARQTCLMTVGTTFVTP